VRSPIYFTWKRATIISIPNRAKTLSNRTATGQSLSSISKIYEKVVLSELHKHLTDKIRLEQSAFRRDHSTTQQLLKFIDHICDNLNSNIHTASIFLDVEKAFDRVWHDGIIYKMSTLNIPPWIIKTISSFLSNRSFCVRIEDQLFSSRAILASVPQGSCLAPTLYLIYTNYISVLARASIALFTDDTMFYTSNYNPNFARIQLERQRRAASDWFEKWRLRINATKTIAILFSRKQTKHLPQLYINNTPIPWSTHVKYLGVTIGRTLNFFQHIQNITQKATKTRGMLFPILNKRRPIPTRNRINIFKMYINPILTYAGAAWAPFITKSQWKKIEAVQTIGLRTILGTPKHVTNRVTLSTTNLKQIKSQIHSQATSFFHKNFLSRFRHIRQFELEEQPTPTRTYKYPKTRPINWVSVNPPS